MLMTTAARIVTRKLKPEGDHVPALKRKDNYKQDGVYKQDEPKWDKNGVKFK